MERKSGSYEKHDTCSSYIFFVMFLGGNFANFAEWGSVHTFSGGQESAHYYGGFLYKYRKNNFFFMPCMVITVNAGHQQLENLCSCDFLEQNSIADIILQLKY